MKNIMALVMVVLLALATPMFVPSCHPQSRTIEKSSEYSEEQGARKNTLRIKASPTKLTEDLMSAGITPGREPEFVEKLQTKHTPPFCYRFNNGHYFLSRQGDLDSIKIEKPQTISSGSLDDAVSTFELYTTDGRDFFNMTKDDIIREYGPASYGFDLIEEGNNGLILGGRKLKAGESYSLIYCYQVQGEKRINISFDFLLDNDGKMKLEVVSVSHSPLSEITAIEMKKEKRLFSWAEAK